MLKNPKAKGSLRERQVRDIMIQAGYHVIKTGGSLGAFDLLCIQPIPSSDPTKDVKAIQVKSNRCSKKERQALEAMAWGWELELWIKPDYKPWLVYRRVDGRFELI